jgi:hypothetical protein
MPDVLRKNFLQDVFISNSMRESATSDQRTELSKVFHEELVRIGAFYSTNVTEEQHIQNIRDLTVHIIERCRLFLEGGTIRFGVTQKALNSYLKYLWCDGQIPEPPHCPFDAIIIEKLDDIPEEFLHWTRGDETAYRCWVSAARKKAGRQTLSEWELYAWNGFFLATAAPTAAP